MAPAAKGAAVALPSGWHEADERYVRPPIEIDIAGAGIALPSLRLGQFQTVHVTVPAPASTSTTRNLVGEETGHLRDDPTLWASSQLAWIRGTGWRDPTATIGAPAFYPTFSRDKTKRLLGSASVREQIRTLAEARAEAAALPATADRAKIVRAYEEQLEKSARTMAKPMVARLDSPGFMRFTGAVVHNALSRMYHEGIHAQPDEITRLRATCLRAQEKGRSVILLPNHSSHIDYLSVSWLCLRLGIALPHIIAGANLNMPVVGPALQRNGAVYIRRSFNDGPSPELYGTMMREYVTQILEDGHNLEIYIEGTRSRTGKRLPPKLGIIKYIVEALGSGRIEDCDIVPISIQYDKVIESASYVSELLGTPKQSESLAGLLGQANLLNLRMGRVDVRFADAFSLREFLAAQTKRREGLSTGSTSPGTAEAASKHQVAILRALGYRVLSQINEVSVAMPAALVATVLLTLRGRGIGRNELIRRFDWLRESIVARGGRVADLGAADSGTVVDRTIKVLGDLVGEHTDVLEPTFFAAKRFSLSIARNQVIHVFVAESLMCAALYKNVKQGGGAANQRMSKQELLSELAFLSDLLRAEFIWPVDGIVQNSIATLDRLVANEVLQIEEDGAMVGLSAHERATGREHYDFHTFLIWPFIEAYWMGATALFALTPPADVLATGGCVWFEERDFQKRAQLLGKTLFRQGDLSYLEAASSQILSNAFERLVELGAVETRRSKAAKSVPLVSLAPDWTPSRAADGSLLPQGRLWDLLDRLSAFRREGKNRSAALDLSALIKRSRDNSTVSARVLALANAVSPTIAVAADAKL